MRKLAHPRTRLAVSLVAGLLFIAPARGASLFGDILLSVDPEPKGESTHGYVEYWITLTNQSSQKAHQVTLTLPETEYPSREDRIRVLTRTVEVGPGATVRVSLLQPDRPALDGKDLAVAIDGRRQDDPVRLAFASTGGRSSLRYGGSFGGYSSISGMSTSLVLLSRGVKEGFLDWIQVMNGGGALFAPPGVAGPGVKPVARPGGRMPEPPPGGGELAMPEPEPGFPGGPPGGPAMPGTVFGTPSVQFTQSEVPVTSWGGNWLGYSRYDGIVLTGDELRTAPASVQSALWQYTECGGTLLILGDANIPDSWKRREQKGPGWTSYPAGFGSCLIARASDRWDPGLWATLSAEWKKSALPWQRYHNMAETNRRFPVVDDLGVPVRGLFILMILFALTIGPVNLYVLARKQRRIWMLWTVPAISLTTCLAVFGYMLLVEGWQGHLRTESMTLLDETAHRATTLGWTAFYSPVTPGDGLRFSTDTELSIQGLEYSYGGGGSSCTLDWSEDQHLARGWVNARVPASFMVRKSEARRERVPIRKSADGTITMVNGLGAAIEQFWYADEKGQIYTAQQIQPGAEAVLSVTKDPTTIEARADLLRGLYTNEWLDTVRTVQANARHTLLPRSYLATLDASPFLEDGLRNAKTRKYRSMVLGLPRDNDDEN
jgi:hypothetical protein